MIIITEFYCKGKKYCMVYEDTEKSLEKAFEEKTGFTFCDKVAFKFISAYNVDEGIVDYLTVEESRLLVKALKENVNYWKGECHWYRRVN